MLKQFGKLILCSIATTGLFTTLALGQSSLLDKISRTGEIRVGTTGDYSPFTLVDTKTGEFTGYSIDIAKQLAHDLGVELVFVKATWPTLVAGLQAKKYDVAISGITISLERLKTVGFSDPYLNPKLVPVFNKKNVNRFKSLKDLDKPGVKISLQLGTAAEQSAKRFFKNAELYSVDYPVIDYTEVLAGRADATITDDIFFASQIGKEYPDLRMLDVGYSFPSQFFGVMTPRNEQEWLNWLNAWVREKHDQKFFDSVYARYFED